MKNILLVLKLFLLVAFSIVCLSAGFVRADTVWKGPGWYVVAYQYAVILWSGPYQTKDDCERAKPANGDPPDFEYACNWFSQAPSD